MELKAAEITSVISKEIGQYQEQLKMESLGTVLQAGDCVARIYGLEKCKASELLEFEGGVHGIALNLEEGSVGAVLLGDSRKVNEGQSVKSTGRIISVPVGEALTPAGVIQIARARKVRDRRAVNLVRVTAGCPLSGENPVFDGNRCEGYS